MRQPWKQAALAAWMVGIAFGNPCWSAPPLARRTAADRTAYVLDNQQFRHDIAAAESDEQRRALLDNRWEAIKLAVIHCEVASGSSSDFYLSISNWTPSGRRKADLRVSGNLNQPIVEADAESEATSQPAAETAPEAPVPEINGRKRIAIPRRRSLNSNRNPHKLTIVEGDCLADVTLAGESSIHIYGDLSGKLIVKGHSEVVIGGSIRESASIEAEGSVRIFVGGDVLGKVDNKEHLKLWVHGDLRGEVMNRYPTTVFVRVMGDYLGVIKVAPEVRGSISLEVGGFASHAALETLAQLSRFSATIAESDCAPGIYPHDDGPTGFSRVGTTWVVHRQVDARQ